MLRQRLVLPRSGLLRYLGHDLESALEVLIVRFRLPGIQFLEAADPPAFDMLLPHVDDQGIETLVLRKNDKIRIRELVRQPPQVISQVKIEIVFAIAAD